MWPIFDWYSNMPLFVYRIRDVILEFLITFRLIVGLFNHFRSLSFRVSMRVICQLYHGENKLHFDLIMMMTMTMTTTTMMIRMMKMMMKVMMFALYLINTLSWIFIVLAH